MLEVTLVRQQFALLEDQNRQVDHASLSYFMPRRGKLSRSIPLQLTFIVEIPKINIGALKFADSSVHSVANLSVHDAIGLPVYLHAVCIIKVYMVTTQKR